MRENTVSVKSDSSERSKLIYPKSKISDVVKRVTDVVVSALGIIFLSPLFALIAIGIRRDSPGPIIYRGPRVGRGGEIFHILKFRTMYERLESYQGPRVTADDDPRVTPFGRWLRGTKLNELPQLWNVLVGEMSLVGPRPEDPELWESWPDDAKHEVLSVRPGITSPASVLYRNEASLLLGGELIETYRGEILPSKLRVDQLYVRHRSFLLDLDILLWTFLVLLPRQLSIIPPEENLFLGPLSRLFGRYVNWFIIDTLVTFVAMGITGVFWRSLGPLNVGLPKAIGIALGFAFLFSISGALLGVNRIDWSKASATEAVDLIPPALLATIIALLVNSFIAPSPLLPPQMILMAAILAFFGFVMVRYRSRMLSEMASRWLMIRGSALVAQERVLIVGGGETGQFMTWLLGSGKAGYFYVVGFVDDDMYKQGIRIRGVEVIGRRDDIPNLVSENDVGIIIFAIHNIPAEERQQLLDICSSTPAKIMQVPDVMGALWQVANGAGGKDQPVDDGPQEGISSQEVYLEGIPSQQVEDWLLELSELATLGETEAIQTRVQELRARISKQEVAGK